MNAQAFGDDATDAAFFALWSTNPTWSPETAWREFERSSPTPPAQDFGFTVTGRDHLGRIRQLTGEGMYFEVGRRDDNGRIMSLDVHAASGSVGTLKVSRRDELGSVLEMRLERPGKPPLTVRASRAAGHRRDPGGRMAEVDVRSVSGPNYRVQVRRDAFRRPRGFRFRAG